MSQTIVYPTIDTYVHQQYPTTNYGSAPEIAVIDDLSGGKGAPEYVAKGYVQHALSGLGITYDQVTSAYLLARQSLASTATSFQKYWRRVIDSWVESTLTWDGQTGFTFGSEESDKLLNHNCHGEASPPTYEDPGENWWKWDVTTLLVDALQDRSGLLNMQLTYTGFDVGILNQLWLYSSDTTSSDYLPYFIINYSVDAVRSPQVIFI